MLSPSERAISNLEEARGLRACGLSYRQIGRRLALSSGQLAHIKRALKREKAAGTRLRKAMPDAPDRDLPVAQSVLPAGLRRTLAASGFRTLGEIADRLGDPAFAGLESIEGIGPRKATLVMRLLDHYGLHAGPDNLRAAIEQLFPELADEQ